MNTSKPVTRDAVEKSKEDIGNSLQRNLLDKLILETNKEINDATVRNQTACEIIVPSVMFGYPAYSAQEIAKQLSNVYSCAGFATETHHNAVLIRW